MALMSGECRHRIPSRSAATEMELGTIERAMMEDESLCRARRALRLANEVRDESSEEAGTAHEALVTGHSCGVPPPLGRPAWPRRGYRLPGRSGHALALRSLICVQSQSSRPVLAMPETRPNIPAVAGERCNPSGGSHSRYRLPTEGRPRPSSCPQSNSNCDRPAPAPPAPS
jgi:hypothetical protein